MKQTVTERILREVGNKQIVSNGLAFLATALITAVFLFWVLSMKPVSPPDQLFRFAWVAGSGAAVWCLCTGFLDAKGTKYATDKSRIEDSNIRWLLGVTKAAASVLPLVMLLPIALLMP